MMTFLFVDTERVWRGGQDQLFSLLRGLVERGHEVHLACHPGTLLEDRARSSGVAIHRLAIRAELDPVYFVRLLSLLWKVHPEILAFNTPRPILVGVLASRLAGVKGRLVFRRVSFPLRRNIFTRFKYRYGIDCIVAISESIRSQLEIGGVPREKIRIIYEGFDVAQLPPGAPRRAMGAEGIIKVGTVAHLSQEKGLQYLVDAAALIPDAAARMRFVLVGDGDCREELEQRVRLRGLERCFEFTGFQDNPWGFFQSFDIFVLPSLSEGLSSSILTAMAASLPVVATDVGGIPELVRDGENGLLVPPADPAALAKAIQRLAADGPERRRMGREGRIRLERNFTLERKIRETEQLCASFL
jgi:glycosyltransferase involved in cell wall biosynthesis